MKISDLTERSQSELTRRLSEYYTVDKETGCHLWTKSFVAGYPTSVFYVAEKDGEPWKKISLKMHRMALSVSLGRELMDSEFALHRCDKKACINAAHLYAGDHAQNMKDRAERTWRPGGETSSMAKLTNAQAMEIKTSKLPTAQLAERFGVSGATVTRIRAGATWKILGKST